MGLTNRRLYESRTSNFLITQAFLLAVLAPRLPVFSDLPPVSPQFLYVIHPLELSGLTPANGMQQISVLPTSSKLLLRTTSTFRII